MPAEREITVKLTKTEALALAKVAETGLRVTEALSLIQSIATAEAALRKLRVAAG